MTEKQVLEFTLEDSNYCVDIEYVSEIVRRSGNDVTSVPNSPAHIAGVMDLRGEATKIIDLRAALSMEESIKSSPDKVIVFDGEKTGEDAIGWAVDGVERVTTIETEDVEKSEEGAIKGIVNRDDGFLLWTAPATITANL